MIVLCLVIAHKIIRHVMLTLLFVLIVRPLTDVISDRLRGVLCYLMLGTVGMVTHVTEDLRNCA